jgi:hypothetical protein
MESKFKIGDLVRLIDEPTAEGTVTEVLYSSGYGWIYLVNEGNGREQFRPEKDLDLVPKKKDFSMDIKIDIAQNVVIATLYEYDGEILNPIIRGHGHIIHDGELGIAQAASYACMRLYKKLGGFE